MKVQPLHGGAPARDTALTLVAGARIEPIVDDPGSRSILASVLNLMHKAGMNARVEWPVAEATAVAGMPALTCAVDDSASGLAVLEPGMTVQPVRGRRGLWPGHQPLLDVLIVGIDASAGDPRYTELLHKAQALTTHLERSRTRFALSANGQVGPLCGPGIDRQSVAQTAADLVARPESLDVIVTTQEHADILVATAAAACGQQCGLPRAQRDGDVVRMDNAAHDACGETDVGAMIEAGVLLLRLLGARTVAQRIEDALVATLETGLHPPSQRLALPYSRKLASVDFVAAVCERLGSLPRREECRNRIRVVADRRPNLHSVG